MVIQHTGGVGALYDSARRSGSRDLVDDYAWWSYAVEA